MPPRKKKEQEEVSVLDIVKASTGKELYSPSPIKIFIPTGVPQLDWAIGGFGWPSGRIVELFGPPGSGKTGLALIACRSAITMGGCAVFIDGEKALDVARLPKLGFSSVDPPNFYAYCPETLEDCHSIIEGILSNHSKLPNPIVIVWDSYVSCSPKAELEAIKKGKKETVAMSSRANSAWFRRTVLNYAINSPVCIIIINQLRDTIGVWSPRPGAKTTKSPGGKALSFYSSLRVETNSPARIPATTNSQSPGIFMNCTVVKNRQGPSHRVANFPFYEEGHGGVDGISALIHYSILKGVLPISGNTVVYNNQKMMKPKLWSYLYENPQELEKLKSACRDMFNGRTDKKDVILYPTIPDEEIEESSDEVVEE